jgi:hypothetical protein
MSTTAFISKSFLLTPAAIAGACAFYGAAAVTMSTWRIAVNLAVGMLEFSNTRFTR